MQENVLGISVCTCAGPGPEAQRGAQCTAGVNTRAQHGLPTALAWPYGTPSNQAVPGLA